jgi:bifunctional non-homologous end joining protein LigD
MDARFVVHEHDSSHLHYDFRLELDGVLKSWAIPKGPSMNPADKRLALMVEDHPLEYGKFEGIIPKGQYGAGPVAIWDEGSFQVLERKADRISLVLEGRRLRGGFTLTLLKGRGRGNEWLLIKRRDEAADPGWKPERCLTPEKRAQLKERIPPCETS